jgi:hypothetical protein
MNSPGREEPTAVRLLISVAVGLVVGGAALVACSGLDPNPPHPDVQPDPGVQPEPLSDLPDGSTDGDRPDASGDAP